MSRTRVQKAPISKCPICGNYYEDGLQALSRYTDLEICGNCGINEAFSGPSETVKMLVSIDEDVTTMMEAK